jgi:GTP-binding protein HflX
LTKCDGVTDSSERIDSIANDLIISNPIAISSRTGYGIHKLKTMIRSNLYSQSPSKGEQPSESVKIMPAAGTGI